MWTGVVVNAQRHFPNSYSKTLAAAPSTVGLTVVFSFVNGKLLIVFDDLPFADERSPSNLKIDLILHAVQLTHTTGNDAHVGWSPDGERLVFTSSRMGFKDEVLYTDGAPQPYGEIFVMHYDGTEVEQLTDNQWEDGGPTWQIHRADSAPVAAPAK